jgi:hypothetical protein
VAHVLWQRNFGSGNMKLTTLKRVRIEREKKDASEIAEKEYLKAHSKSAKSPMRLKR